MSSASEASGEGCSDYLEGEFPSPGALRAADLSLRPPRRGEARHFHLIAYEELWRMLKDVVSARSWRERLRSVLGPPA